ncbi:MAG TPA: PPOX class F420-dependent oxidoreductase [Arenicellales bacterium]|jgi:PPOX class probable F420-dependent enzyme|nr:PPOX class F420-dependent oxidoreductase [Arenicellales bacterium]HJL52189.1 PPOX class F420-dependent oxidoreductase [Arenicellales bacterium]
MEISESSAKLLSWEKKSFAHLALVLADGTPQCTPLWFDYDGTHLIINSARGRVKDKAMRQSPHVALAISDPDDPYRYIQIRGQVTEITEQGARDMIDHLSEKYLGKPFDHGDDEIRVTYKILPESIQTNI